MYTDPTGHFWWVAAGAAVGAAVAYGAQVAGNLNQGMDLGQALTTNIDGTAIVAGALTGAALVMAAPVAVALAGEALMGLGLATGSTAAFTAGTTVAGAGATLGGIVYGTSSTAQNKGPTTSSSAVNGNNKASTKPQHGYEIRDTKNGGDVVKTGISGQPLNKDGSSHRANSQVNAWNKQDGSGTYSAQVVKTNMPNRAAALRWEQNNVIRLHRAGNSLRRHTYPRPQ